MLIFETSDIEKHLDEHIKREAARGSQKAKREENKSIDKRGKYII